MLRLIDDLRDRGLAVNSVVITRFSGEPAAEHFAKKLESRGIRTYKHRPIPGYPLDVDAIVSDEGYGSNSWIETTRPIVVVTAPGPGSGKLATCLSQLYNENKRGSPSLKPSRSGTSPSSTPSTWPMRPPPPT